MVAAVVVGLVPATAVGQDTHYWHNQYGPKSMLLSGAVVGSVHDMSATYYNPGALGYIKKPELLLSANAYQIRRLKVEDGAGEGIDLENSDFNPLPNLLAGAFNFEWLGANKLAYSFLTRYRFDAELSGSSVTEADVLPEYPGDESFAGGVLRSAEVKELWAGLTLARGINEHVGFGITTYLTIRNQSSEYELIAQALAQSGEIALAYDIDNYNADMYGLLWKVGLGFRFTPFTAGVTLTTPNLDVAGSGSAVVNQTRIGLDLDDDGIIDDGFTTNIQEGVAANYKSPLSIGVGAAWQFTSTNIHFSAEWFSEIDTYDVMELASFESQATGETVNLPLRHKAASVVNFGAGVEHDFKERITGFLSFNTDQSSYDAESDVAVTGYDIYHCAGGANFELKRTELMLGLRYAWGSQDINQDIDLNPGDGEGVISSDDEVTASYTQITFLIGFKVNL